MDNIYPGHLRAINYIDNRFTCTETESISTKSLIMMFHVANTFHENWCFVLQISAFGYHDKIARKADRDYPSLIHIGILLKKGYLQLMPCFIACKRRVRMIAENHGLLLQIQRSFFMVIYSF